ncbi:MAG: DUF1799 domain-containing protein [Sulfuricella denitrificans]|nr:DUF1799 domain-containing protein [Sulfuricella denitrificans]
MDHRPGHVSRPRAGRRGNSRKKRLISRARWEFEIGWGYIEDLQKAGREIDPADLPPELEWEHEIWRLFERVKTQWHYSFKGKEGLDYNPAIKLIEHFGWDLDWALELLQVIESTVMKERGKKSAEE